MKTELQHLTDEQLLEEIKRQWYEKGHWDYELNQLPEEEAFTPANDYMGHPGVLTVSNKPANIYLTLLKSKV